MVITCTLALRAKRLAQTGRDIHGDPFRIAANQYKHQDRREVWRHGHDLCRNLYPHRLHVKLQHGDSTEKVRPKNKPAQVATWQMSRAQRAIQPRPAVIPSAHNGV